MMEGGPPWPALRFVGRQGTGSAVTGVPQWQAGTAVIAGRDLAVVAELDLVQPGLLAAGPRQAGRARGVVPRLEPTGAVLRRAVAAEGGRRAEVAHVVLVQLLLQPGTRQLDANQ